MRFFMFGLLRFTRAETIPAHLPSLPDRTRRVPRDAYEHPVLTRKDFMGAHEWCQPPDTQVLTPSGSTPISSLRDGDRVVSFSRHQPAIVGLRDGLDIRVTSRPYDGSLYGVGVGDRTTWCTDGHIWSVRMTPAAKSKWCVYLMQRGNWWRVGRCKLYTTWGLGVKQRLMMESGDAALVAGRLRREG